VSDEYDVIEYKPESRALTLGALPTTGPVALIQQASEIATELARIIKDRRLTSRIRNKEFVHVEGWSTMGAMLGVLPREVTDQTRRLDDGSYEATVELIRINDGAVIGRASAICGMDEKDGKGKLTWANRAEYARRSMAVTRATGKAYRLGFSWIMALAGYEPTPAEEMVDTPEPQRTTRPAKQTTPAPSGNGEHWIKNAEDRKRFWVWAKGDRGLSEDEVHEALKVKHLADYAGSKADAMAALNDYVDAKVQAEQQAAEAAQPEAEGVEA